MREYYCYPHLLNEIQEKTMIIPIDAHTWLATCITYLGNVGVKVRHLASGTEQLEVL